MTGRHRASWVDSWCSEGCVYGYPYFGRAHPKQHERSCSKLRRLSGSVNPAPRSPIGPVHAWYPGLEDTQTSEPGSVDGRTFPTTNENGFPLFQRTETGQGLRGSEPANAIDHLEPTVAPAAQRRTEWLPSTALASRRSSGSRATPNGVRRAPRSARKSQRRGDWNCRTGAVDESSGLRRIQSSRFSRVIRAAIARTGSS